MAVIAFSLLHKTLLSLWLAVYVETHCGGDFRRSLRNGSAC
jgi:hypothetical protein